MPDEVIAGRYRLIEPLGRGAMSSVWLAEDQELGRRVAVKMLGPTADRERFAREARAAAALSHPNIAGVYDYGEADGRPYMVLEHLPNGSLEDRLKGSLPDEETTRISTEIAAGLAHAHARGLVHRDLKPANILFDSEGRAKIADFGIARMGTDGTLTEAGTVLGTASYISPEQASGQTAGPASDVYSFGVILFRMLTGQLPFVSGNAMELVRMHRDDEPPPISAFRADAPANLESVATAALAKDPADRPADGSALLHALRSGGEPGTVIMSALPADATQVLRPARPPRGPRRTLLPLVVLALVLLGGGVALAIALTHGSGTTTPTTTAGSLTLPTVATSSTSSGTTTTAPTTTAPTKTTTPTTTQRTTTHKVKVAPPPTTAPTTTVAPPTTTLAPPTTTVAPPPTTTAVTTTTTPTTTAPPPTTTAP